MSKKGGHDLESWRARKPRESYQRIAITMIESPAYKALTKLQSDLLWYCMKWTYDAISRSPRYADPQKYPRDRWVDGGGIRDGDFYANRQKAKECGLLTNQKNETFYNARKRLVSLGFIDCIIGGSRPMKLMSVYRMSERWKEITESDVKRIKAEKNKT